MGKLFRDIDWITVLLVIILASFGMFTLLSIGSKLFYQQLLFLLVGLGVMYGVSRIDGVVLSYFSPYFYIGSILFIALTYFSPDIRGASRWIDIGPVQLQPSELVKPFLLLFYATMMTRFSPRKFRYLLLHLVLFLIPFFLVFKQPDLGSSIVYTSFWIIMLFAGGISLPLLFAVSALGIAGIPLLWNFLAPFQKLRIISFLNPSFDPRGAGYNAFQAMISVGSGQLFGKGLGKGTQSHLQFLPEYHTDFIFATLIEELGFLGGILLFFIYGIFLWRFIRPFLKKDRYDNVFFFYTFGFFGMMLTQIFINTGMNMGIIPVTGITLPFVSYGGSSLVSICLSIGFLWALRRKAQMTII
jgi:rod shape determining protein RodA